MALYLHSNDRLTPLSKNHQIKFQPQDPWRCTTLTNIYIITELCAVRAYNHKQKPVPVWDWSSIVQVTVTSAVKAVKLAVRYSWERESEHVEQGEDNSGHFTHGTRVLQTNQKRTDDAQQHRKENSRQHKICVIKLYVHQLKRKRLQQSNK